MKKDDQALDESEMDIEQDHPEVEGSGDSDTEKAQTTREAEEDAGDAADSKGSSKKGKTDAERLKNTRDELLRVNQEKAELNRKLDELSGKLEGVIQMTQAKAEQKDEPNPFAFLDDEETISKLYEDPKNMAKVLKQMVGYIGQTFSARDQALLEEVQKRVKDVDPERRALAAKMAELRKDPENAIFTDEQLVVLARREAAKEKQKNVDDDDDDDTDGFRGSVGGGGRRVVVKREAKDADEEKFYRMLRPDDI